MRNKILENKTINLNDLTEEELMILAKIETEYQLSNIMKIDTNDDLKIMLKTPAGVKAMNYYKQENGIA